MPQRSNYQMHAAGGLKALGGVYGYLMASGLPKALLDLVYLRASQINGCAYCIDLHAHDARGDGATAEKLMLLAVWREAGAYFTDRERAALAWTESVTRVADTRIPDAEYADVSVHFTEKQLADLTLAIALINTYNRMAIAFRRPPDSLQHVSAPPSAAANEPSWNGSPV